LAARHGGGAALALALRGLAAPSARCAVAVRRGAMPAGQAPPGSAAPKPAAAGPEASKALTCMAVLMGARANDNLLWIVLIVPNTAEIWGNC